MGTWGIEWFQDDLALDIKDEFHELIEDMDVKEASKELINSYADLYDESPKLWITLAILQKEENSLEEKVKGKALKYLKEMTFEEWESHPMLEERKEEISKIIKYIEEGEGKFNKKKRKAKKLADTYKNGDVYAYRIDDKYIYFVVYNIDELNEELIIYIYNYCSTHISDILTLKEIEYMVEQPEYESDLKKISHSHKYQIRGDIPVDKLVFLGSVGKVIDIDKELKPPYVYMHFTDWKSIERIELIQLLLGQCE